MKLNIVKQSYTGGADWGYYVYDNGKCVISGSLNYHSYPDKQTAKREILRVMREAQGFNTKKISSVSFR